MPRSLAENIESDTNTCHIFDFIKDDKVWYDRMCFLTLTAENGLKGRVVQDVITRPKKKYASLQGEKARLDAYTDYTDTLDLLSILEGKEVSATGFNLKIYEAFDSHAQAAWVYEILQGIKRQLEEKDLLSTRGW